MVTKEVRKMREQTLQKDMAENKRQAALYLYQQELAKTKGGEPPKPIDKESNASIALFYLREEIKSGDKTAEELYRLYVLKETPSRVRKTRMSKAQREQARKDRLATLQAEAEARHDARYANNTLQALGRTAIPPMHKRKRSVDSNESSESNAKRQKRAGSNDKKLVDSVEPGKEKKRKRDEDDEGQGKRQKREASDRDVLATTKEQQIVREKKVIKSPVLGGKKAPAAAEQAAPAKKRKRDDDDAAEEASKHEAPLLKRARNDSTSRPESKTAGGSKAVEAQASTKKSESVPAASKVLKPVGKEESQKSNTTEPLASKDVASKVTPKPARMTASEFFKSKRRIPLDIKTINVKIEVQKKPVKRCR